MFKPVLTTPDAIRKFCREANADDTCAGLITWMHTFSPAKMWIAGLSELRKPLLHLHTQFNRDIPWDSIDMDFMNLNQAAHGDREYGFIGTRMGISRKVIVGYWEDPEIRREIGRLGARGRRLRRRTKPESRPLRRQHARGRRHRRRQSGGADTVRLVGQRLRRRRFGRARQRLFGRRSGASC